MNGSDVVQNSSIKECKEELYDLVHVHVTPTSSQVEVYESYQGHIV